VSAGTGAILVAAGSSQRMGFDKLWTELAGQYVIAYALKQLLASRLIDQVALVVAAARRPDAERLLDGLGGRATLCLGGERRRDSVAAGLDALGDPSWVLVHDAARPFLVAALIERGLAAARATGAAVAAVPARDTIKRVADGLVVETPSRAELWLVQTPQVFRGDLLRSALALPDDVTDEATLVERLGGQVRIFAGDDTNWKITTPADLRLAEALLGGAVHA
jgi:2-C-methyl-D-erythritol 4-phosphate cytidylyltransferase